MKKPSEWTAQEAWSESARAHFRMLAAGGVAVPTWVKTLDFPPDPVERVSDDELTGWTEDGMMRPVRLMALELIERRAKDDQK